MLLQEHLSEYTKEELLEQARSFELKKYSGLRKAELIDRIVMKFCSEEMVRSRFACLTKEQMDLFRKACISPTDISSDEVVDSMMLFSYWIGYFEDPSDKFCVFEDVAEAFHKIDDEAFRADNYKKGWMSKCINFFIQYYGIAPIEIIYEMYKQRISCSIDEMIDMMDEIQMDMIESAIIPMHMLGLSDWPKDNPLYSDRGILVHVPLLDIDEIWYLLDKQANKDFYVPSAKLIDDINRIGYDADAQAYKKLETFFMEKVGLPYEQAVTWCLQVWANSYERNSPAEVMNEISEAQIIFESEEIVNEFVDLLMNAHNNTRMIENRGHRPDELSGNLFSRGMPTIVPGSSHAAEMLKEAAPQLQAMGFPVDINGSADVIQTNMFPNGLNGEMIKAGAKIYPNDPCPCGSGKKYKKCCGRNN